MTPTAAPVCCVGAVLVADEKLLLIRRKNPPAQNLWSLPGGRVEPGESWQAAVEREVREETALEASCGEFIGWVEREAENRRYLIADFEIEALNLEKARPGDDATELIFVSRSQLNDLDLSPGLIEFLSHHKLLEF
ncbi:MAG: NUDIX hydrolase [Acidimicrobiaceae bacterium]|nr:NUDIX hydrolase [Acidimicrobiaceae bacterium]